MVTSCPVPKYFWAIFAVYDIGLNPTVFDIATENSGGTISTPNELKHLRSFFNLLPSPHHWLSYSVVSFLQTLLLSELLSIPLFTVYSHIYSNSFFPLNYQPVTVVLAP